MLDGYAVSWCCAKKFFRTSYTMVAQFITCYEASNYGIQLRNIVTGLQIMERIERSLKLYCDNKLAIM